MGKPQSFVITFDNPTAVYFPGQNVTGFVNLQLSEATEMRGIKLKLVGRAYLHWSTTTHSNGHSHTRHYSAEEYYFNVTVMLVGSAESSHRMTLNPGSYRYPFSVTLPPTLPSSFEGGTGYVRYVAESLVDRPWKFDHVTRTAFTVIGLVDLNVQPLEYRQTFEMNTDGKVSCCCWNGGKVTASLHLARRCFVPGETIFVNGEIVNNSKSDITSIKLRFHQINTFRATGGHTRCGEILRASIERNQKLKPGATDTWNNVMVAIPPVPPTMLGGGCKIIDVKYFLIMTIAAKCTDVKLPVEILVGTIPLQQQQQQRLAFPSVPTCESSAGEATCIKQDGDADVYGNMMWAPRYPYFAPPTASPVSAAAT